MSTSSRSTDHFPSPTSPFIPSPSQEDELERIHKMDRKVQDAKVDPKPSTLMLVTEPNKGNADALGLPEPSSPQPIIQSDNPPSPAPAPIPSPSNAFSQSQSITGPQPDPHTIAAHPDSYTLPSPSLPETTLHPPPRTTDPSTSPLETPHASPAVQIRDFAYPKDNPLHTLPSQLAGRSNNEEGSRATTERPSFGWGEYGSGGSGEVEEEWEDESDYDDEDEDEDEDDDHDEGKREREEDEEDCTPGLYKALYAFQSEAPSELSLAEGDLIRVHRAGGVGWVIATLVSEKGETAERSPQGLVPRGYLRFIEG